MIGEPTAGAANPGGYHPISDHLRAFIPDRRSVNPVTGASWEGTGVLPHHQVESSEALEVAHVMAREATVAQSAARDQHLQARWSATDALLMQARSRFRESAFDESAELRQQATTQHPDYGAAWLSLGYAYHFGERYEDALVAYDEAAKVPVTRAEALYQLGCVYSLLNRKTESVKCLAEAVDAGFASFSFFIDDSDLDNVRGEPGFPRPIQKKD